MTDEDAIEHALSAVDPGIRGHVLLRRNGRPFMALPADRDTAIHAINLYQPQRPKAVLAMVVIRLLVITGFHRMSLPKLHGIGGKLALDPEFAGCLPGTAGVMLGSPEHRVRRALLSYKTDQGWEVAKLAFGHEGRTVIDGEYAALSNMPSTSPGIPQALGVHHGEEFSILRLPYIHGHPLPPRQGTRGLDLLESWIRDLPARPAGDFSEWPAIESALETSKEGKRALARLAEMQLRPVIRHGDFARWNLLRQNDGSLMVVDWEWGHPMGMPGLDLVHFFLQDVRLVKRLPPAAAIAASIRELQGPTCAGYFEKTGWTGDALLPVIASLAWKQGAKQQDNVDVLEAALRMG
ncbi:MAG: phosphotransferase family protein [Luteolibacter sp.]